MGAGDRRPGTGRRPLAVNRYLLRRSSLLWPRPCLNFNLDLVPQWNPVQRVTDSPAADVLPVFSPDGSQLMWTSTRSKDSSSQLFLADFHLPR